MSKAASLREQQRIYDLLVSAPDFAQVHIFAEAYGVAHGDTPATEAAVDGALGAHYARAGKRAGLVLMLLAPRETAEKGASPIMGTRTHTVRIIEVPEVCRKSGGPKDGEGDTLNADLAKDYATQRLHYRPMGRATLMWSGSKPWRDVKGGEGWEVSFDILMSLGSEVRAKTPIISISGTTVTLTGSGDAGEKIYYTLDGRHPTPGTGHLYAAPFIAPSGTLVCAAAIATGKELGGASEDTV